MYRLLKNINKYTNMLSEKIITIALTGMTLFTFLQVVFRYGLKTPISWAGEISIYLFVWMTFIGAAVAIREHTHPRVIEFVRRIKKKKIQKGLTLFAKSLVFVFFAMLVFYGIKISMILMLLKQSSPTIPFLNVSIVYFAIPVGSLFAGLHLIESLVEFFKDDEAISPPNAVEDE